MSTPAFTSRTPVGHFIGGERALHADARTQAIYNPATGNWTAVNDPEGVQGTVLNGINDKGEMVGFFTDAAGNVHGMIVTGGTMP